MQDQNVNERQYVPAAFSFGQIDAIFASFHKVAEHKRVAFASRLKALMKAGLAGDSAPGRGRAGSYNLNSVFTLALGLELTQAGVPPVAASRIARRNRGRFLTAAARESFELLDRGLMYLKNDSYRQASLKDDLVAIFQVEGLAELTLHNEESYRSSARIARAHDISGTSLFASKQSRHFGSAWRTLVLNVSLLTRELLNLICFKFKFFAFSTLMTDMKAFSDHMRKRLDLDLPAFKDVMPEEVEGWDRFLPVSSPPSFTVGRPEWPVPLWLWTEDEIDQFADVLATREQSALSYVQSIFAAPCATELIHLRTLAKNGLFSYHDGTIWLTWFGRQILRRLGTYAPYPELQAD